MACSGLVGWKGAASTNGGTLPFVNGNLYRCSNLFKPTLIGYGNAAQRSPYNYVKAQEYVEGSFTCELFGAGYASIGSLISACVNGTSVSLSFASGGGDSISVPGEGLCYISNMTLNGNNKGISKVTFSIIATDEDSGGGDSATLFYETPGVTEDQNPVPWYFTSFSLSGAGDSISDSVIEWSLTFSNNPELIFALNGSPNPVTIRLGTTSLNGTVSYLTDDNAKLTDGGSLTIDCGPRTLTCPYIVITNDSKPSNSANDIVVRTLTFEGFGSEGNKVLSV